MGGGVSSTVSAKRTSQAVFVHDLLAGHSRMDAVHRHLVGLRIGAHDAEIGDQQRGAPGANAKGPAFAAGASMSKRSEKVELAGRNCAGPASSR